MQNKTFMQSKEAVVRQWHLVDVSDKILGRVASEIAQKLIGKHKKEYTPHIDAGDYVVVINAAAVAVTGNKPETKLYRRHSGYMGGLKEQTYGELQAKYPERIIEKAVYNMLPKNKLRSDRMTRLKVYAADQHPHKSQFDQAETKEA